MSKSKVFVTDVGIGLYRRGEKLPVPQLAELLNCNGCRTVYGAKYRGARGTYRLIHATWNTLTSQGRHEEAKAVAQSFVKPDGTLAWD